MKHQNAHSHWALLVLLLFISIATILYGCHEKRQRPDVTSPGHAIHPISLYFSKGILSRQGTATSLTISVIEAQSGQIAASQSFANPTFPVETSFEVLVPPCDYTIQADATLLDGQTDSAGASVNACEFTGGVIELAVLADQPTPTPSPSAPPSPSPTPTSTGTPYPTATPSPTATPTVVSSYTVTVATANTGGGSGTVSGGGTFPGGTEITLSASPDAPATFVNWVGDVCNGSTANPCTFTLTTDVAVTANFGCTGLTYTGTFKTACECNTAGGWVDIPTGASGSLCRFYSASGGADCPTTWTVAGSWGRYATNAELLALASQAQTVCESTAFYPSNPGFTTDHWRLQASVPFPSPTSDGCGTATCAAGDVEVVEGGQDYCYKSTSQAIALMAGHAHLMEIGCK